MPTCTIDGKQVEFQKGENLVEVAKRVGVEIPVYCYHPGLTVVAQCRMCTIEVEGIPKLLTACSQQAADGMVVYTQSDKVKRNRAAVQEFLLVNHPLDCPICDKSGECDLQDFSYDYGNAYMRTTEERRTYLNLDMGPVIEKNMNRCIHCTRCIRFGDEIAHIREMVAIKRGNDTEITTLDGRSLETDYAGCYSDICPTGSLTLKDFRFKKRAWMLKKTPTICEGCSRGCNMEVQQDANVIYRCVPRENLEINRYWMCDEGRFNYHYLQDKFRIVEPSKVESSETKFTDWQSLVTWVREESNAKKTTVLVGSDLTQEELSLIKDFTADHLNLLGIFHFGTPGVKSTKDDGPEDEILRTKSKTANLNGAEKLGLSPFEKLPSGTELTLVFRGGRAKLPDLSGAPAIGLGVFFKPELKHFSAILPGAAFAEKDGTVFNIDGVEQKYRRAVMPPRQAKYFSEIFMVWSNSAQRSGVA